MTDPIDFAAAETVATECANARADFKHIQELRNLSRAYLALVKDRERLDWLEDCALNSNYPVAINFFDEERGNVMGGESDYHFLGGFQLGDDDSKPYHLTLRAAIDAAMEASRGA